LKLVNEIKYAMSHNVVARLEGTTHANEYIIYSAHWDHLGIGEAVKGDSIYNGAIDNATGCAAILEIAKAFTLQSKKPERSIVFIALTSEEQGLLGSEYYGTHPIYPVKKTVADINIDALSSFGITKDISVIGFGQSELDEYAKASALKQNRVTMKEPNPSAGAFFRSDHFNFAKVGIPSLYTESGINSIAHGSAWGKAQSEDYTAHRYHQSADNFEPATWDFSGMVEDTRLLYDVGNTLANERNFPSWKTGSEFKVIREKSLR
jgi:Zn-dependent M28 family amino/carboxypeptidase